ncbi:MAG TPA: glycosyltransferase family 4 protein [Ktedonobacterales bacterium]|jgi:glycosyltransferase involved in cell wall biosynthesis|nr:glycosyltransferase family 4 protein [Ktedonobacterales bacterium]
MSIWTSPSPRAADSADAPRVLYLNPTADLYGASRCLLNLLARRAPRDWTAEVILPAHGALEDELRTLGIATHILPNLTVARKELLGPRGLTTLAATLLPSAWAVARIARAMRADIIHTNSTVILSGAIAARFIHRPHIWHVREITATSSRLWRWYGPLMLRASQRVICVSQSAADQFTAFPLRQRAQVIYDGLDLSRVMYPAGREHARQSFRLPNDALVIGSMGYLNPRKGADVLIEAAAQIKARYAGRVVVLIAGQPYPGYEAYVERLRARVLSLGLADDVLFAGFVRDVARFYAAIDVFALPTHEPEGFGLTLLEAATAGLPCIASALGGACEVIDDGVTGALIEPGSPTALTEAALRLASDPARRRAMGAAARMRALTQFSLEQTIAQTRHIYESLIEPPRGAAERAEVVHAGHASSARSLPRTRDPET